MCRTVAHVLLCACLVALPAGSVHAADVPEDLAHVYDGADYQTTLPGGGAPAGADGGSSSGSGKTGDTTDADSREGSDRTPPEPFDLSAFGGLSQILEFAGWVILGFIVLVIVFVIVRELAGAQPARLNRLPLAAAEADPGHAATVSEQHVEAWLRDADALAREGRFGEAIHMLLLAVLGRLSRRSRLVWTPATTAREIVAKAGPLGEAAQGLASLVRSSELAHFGGREAGESDFLACRESARRLATELAD